MPTLAHVGGCWERRPVGTIRMEDGRELSGEATRPWLTKILICLPVSKMQASDSSCQNPRFYSDAATGLSARFSFSAVKSALNMRPKPRRSSSTAPARLLAFPQRLPQSNYNMIATVVESGELGFLSSATLESLLRDEPALSRQLLVLLVERVLEVDLVNRSLLENGSAPPQESNIV
jgi:hypothetical protein